MAYKKERKGQIWHSKEFVNSTQTETHIRQKRAKSSTGEMNCLVPIKRKLLLKRISKQTFRNEQINNKKKHIENSLPYSNAFSTVKNLMFILT